MSKLSPYMLMIAVAALLSTSCSTNTPSEEASGGVLGTGATFSTATGATLATGGGASGITGGALSGSGGLILGVTGGGIVTGGTGGGVATGGTAIDTGGTTSLADAGMPASTTGCGKTPTLTSGMHSIQSGGTTRNFIMRIPDNYDNSHPYRLIFAFHWVGGTADDVASGGTDKELWSYYGLQGLSDNTAILVAPQGINNGWSNTGGQDVTFVDDMISQIEGDLCVDANKLFSVGFSFGGAMTYALACARASVFRAVAVYAGGLLSGCSGGTEPIAYLGIHGIDDGKLGDQGGAALRDTFVNANGCTPQIPPAPSPGSLTHICTSYDGCSAGHPVRWCSFDGGHTPGPVDGGGDSGANTWTKGEVWSFFTQF